MTDVSVTESPQSAFLFAVIGAAHTNSFDGLLVVSSGSGFSTREKPLAKTLVTQARPTQYNTVNT